MLVVKPARPDQAGALTRLARASKGHWGYPDDWLTMWSRELSVSPEEIDREPVFTAYLNDALVGWFGLSRGDGVWRLDHFWVKPGFMGQGIGRRMLEQAREKAGACGAESLIIESDPNAEEFYLNMGARRIGRSPSRPWGRLLPVLELTC